MTVTKEEKINNIIESSQEKIASIVIFNRETTIAMSDASYNHVKDEICEQRKEVKVSYTNGKTTLTGLGKCRPEDIFVPEIGKAIANQRVLTILRAIEYTNETKNCCCEMTPVE